MERNMVITETRTVAISKHGRQRMRERSGLNKKSLDRIAEKAYDMGIPVSDIKGSLRKWCESKDKDGTGSDEFRIYGDKLYLFKGGCLVTILQIPAKYVKIANACRRTQ